jgi:sulfur carrier protein
MNISINGESRTLDAGTTAAQLLSLLGLEGRRVAMEINGEIVTRSSWPNHLLCEGDRIELVQAIGGG